MITALTILALLFPVVTAVHAQVQIVPAATCTLCVPEPRPPAGLRYSLRYAQNANFLGNNRGDSLDTILSGNLEYRNSVKGLPFSLTFAGGYSWNLAGISFENGPFENLLISQGIVRHNWKLQVSDNISYRKEAPTTGFSGVPGTGEPIGEPIPTPPSSQTILTLNTRTVNNIVGGEFERNLNHATALSIGGSSELLRYPDGNGLDTNGQTAYALLTRRLTARNSLSGQYIFSDYSYPGNNQALAISSLVTSTALFGYQREWNRQITTNVSIGPQWIQSSNSAVVPSSTKVSGNAMVDYKSRFGSAALSYRHSTGGGAGFLYGAEVDSVSANFSREFERKITIGLTGGYMLTSALNNQGKFNSKFGAAMATIRLRPSLTAFANYTASDQSTNYSLPTNALTTLWQVIGVGIAYSPREKRRNTQ